MTKYGSDSVAFLLIGGYSVLGVTTDIEESVEKFTEETTPLGAAWPTHEQTGLLKAMFSQKGFYDDAANSSNDALVGLSGSDRVLCYGLQGNTIGRGCRIVAGALESKYQRQLSRGALHKAAAEYAVDGNSDDGKILRTLGSDTGSSGNTQASSVDNAASSANGGIGALQVTALTLGGGTSVTFKVRHSTDNVTFADLITFTNVTSAPAAQSSVVAGTVNRYLAASYAFNGSPSGQSVTYMIAFARR